MSTAPICICGIQMIVRTRRSDDRKFFACPTFPKCDHTEAYEWERTGEDRTPSQPQRSPYPPLQ